MFTKVAVLIVILVDFVTSENITVLFCSNFTEYDKGIPVSDVGVVQLILTTAASILESHRVTLSSSTKNNCFKQCLERLKTQTLAYILNELASAKSTH